MEKGGQNRTHGSINDCNRLDSFKTAVSPGRYSVPWLIGGSITMEVEADHVKLAYAVDGQTVNETVKLSTVSNNYGGTRPFFLCPGCDKRVRFLYRPWEWDRFRCRSCWRLNYPSQQERSSEVSAYRQGVKLLLGRFKLPLSQLPTPDKFYDFLPPRPKGMHRLTYGELLRELELIQGEYYRCYYIRTHRIGRRIIW